MLAKNILAAGVALLLTSIPALAQHHGGGGHPGGHMSGGHGGGAIHIAPSHGYSGAHYGGFSGGGVVLNLGLGFGHGGGYAGGYSGSNYYGGTVYRPSYSSGYSVAPSYVGPVPNIAPATNNAYTYPNLVNNPALNPTIRPQNPTATIPLGTETGLKITDLYEGTAKTAGLRKGDIILKVDGTRTQSFEELRATLSAGKDKVVVEYIDGTSGETEKKTVPVDGSKIGVSVAETVIPKT